MSYRIIQKTFSYSQLGKPFTVAEGSIVGILDKDIHEDLSMTVIFVVEEN